MSQPSTIIVPQIIIPKPQSSANTAATKYESYASCHLPTSTGQNAREVHSSQPRSNRSLFDTLKKFGARRKSKIDDFERVFGENSSAHFSGSSSKDMKGRSKSAWTSIKSMRERTNSAVARLQEHAAPVAIRPSQTQPIHTNRWKAQPRRRKSFGDILGSITNKVSSRRSTIFDFRQSQETHAELSMKAGAQQINFSAVTDDRLTRADESIDDPPAYERRETPSYYEDMDNFQSRLEAMLNNFKLEQTQRLAGSVRSAISWRSQQTLHEDITRTPWISRQVFNDVRPETPVSWLQMMIDSHAETDPEKSYHSQRRAKSGLLSMPFRSRVKQARRILQAKRSARVLDEIALRSLGEPRISIPKQTLPFGKKCHRDVQNIDPTFQNRSQAREQRYRELGAWEDPSTDGNSTSENIHEGPQLPGTESGANFSTLTGRQSLRIVPKSEVDQALQLINCEETFSPKTKSHSIFGHPRSPGAQTERQRPVFLPLESISGIGSLREPSLFETRHLPYIKPGVVGNSESHGVERSVIENSGETVALTHPNSVQGLTLCHLRTRGSPSPPVRCQDLQEPLEVTYPDTASQETDSKVYKSKSEATSDMYVETIRLPLRSSTLPSIPWVNCSTGVSRIDNNPDIHYAGDATITGPCIVPQTALFDPTQILDQNVILLTLDEETDQKAMAKFRGNILNAKLSQMTDNTVNSSIALSEDGTGTSVTGETLELKGRRAWAEAAISQLPSHCPNAVGNTSPAVNIPGSVSIFGVDGSQSLKVFELDAERCAADVPAAAQPGSSEQNDDPFLAFDPPVPLLSLSLEQPSEDGTGSDEEIFQSKLPSSPADLLDERIKMLALTPPITAESIPLAGSRTNSLCIAPQQNGQRHLSRAAIVQSAGSRVPVPTSATFPRARAGLSMVTNPESGLGPESFNIRIVGKKAQNSQFAMQKQKKVATLVDLFQARSIIATPSPQGASLQRTPPHRLRSTTSNNTSTATTVARQASGNQRSVSNRLAHDRSSISSSIPGISVANIEDDSFFGMSLDNTKADV